MKTNQTSIKTLVILAAGQGSRFGGAKQFALFGRCEKTLMEYNICHAIDHGFTHLVFISQPKHNQILKQQVLSSLPHSVSYDIVYQDSHDLPTGCHLASTRTKPLGTAHALWCARKSIKGNFAVINADDYYGEQAFQLVQQHGLPNNASLVAYLLKQTLSKHGGVNRGLCQLSAEHKLIAISEIENIHYQAERKLIGTNAKQQTLSLNENALISMNFWCFNLQIFPVLAKLLAETFSAPSTDTTECYLPDAVMKLIEQSAEVDVLTSHDQWFGVTYAADSLSVNQALTALIDKGRFPSLSK
ncbi:hypothetical protein tinsulaeT_11650 [Thalassotalea insulae]|uniref:Nucleotidyl transferase domain-containing protein n=1 Tax=Thalassotalea insulae TaxID=2056778 RepID=A0ABQ6GT11_9GAMM|nr:sugar phosphate nucleotidyltransferase [Thalassotalea insulae]GLX77825.1 hypothetical protein tinsulaeT_11650 [Thalassotalea insulae]